MPTCRCGAHIQSGRRCRDCQLADRYSDGPVGGEGEREDWSVTQQGLGDRDAEGQATLDGGIAREEVAGDE